MNPEQLKQLQQVLGAFSKTKLMTTADIAAVIRGISAVLKTYREDSNVANKESIDRLEAHRILLEDAKKVLSGINETSKGVNKTSDSVKEIEKKVAEDLKSALSDIKKLSEDILKLKPKKGRDGEPGKDADEELIIDKVIQRIEIPEPEKVELDGGEEIVGKINELPTDSELFKIDASHIKNLPQGRALIGGGGSKYLKWLNDVNLTGLSLDSEGKYILGGGSASPLTTKGDIYTYDTDNARLPVGTDGYALVADSNETTGLKWASVSGTPGGSDREIQINDGGAFGAVTGLSIDASGNLLNTVGDFALNADNYLYLDGLDSTAWIKYDAGDGITFNAPTGGPNYIFNTGTVEVNGNINMVQHGNEIMFGSAAEGRIEYNGAYDALRIANEKSNEDIVFEVNDGGVTKYITLDASEFQLASSTGTFDFADDNLTTTGTITTSDEVYGASWNGSLEVPTKNAVYDKIQTLGGTTYTASDGVQLDGDNIELDIDGLSEVGQVTFDQDFLVLFDGTDHHKVSVNNIASAGRASFNDGDITWYDSTTDSKENSVAGLNFQNWNNKLYLNYSDVSPAVTSGQFNIGAAAANDGLAIRSEAAYTGNYFLAEDSAGTDLFYINNTGGAYFADDINVAGVSQADTFQWDNGTSGSVPFIGGSNQISQDNTNFFWDNSNKTLGIGLNTAITTAQMDTRFFAATSGDLGRVTNAVFSTDDTDTPLFDLRKSSSASIGTVAETSDGERLGSLSYSGVNSSSNWRTGASIDVLQNGAAGATYLGADLVFYTSDGTANPVERVRIDKDGNVGIGTSTPDNELEVVGTAQADTFQWDNGTQGSIVFVDGSNQLAQDNDNFFFDSANTVLALGLGGGAHDTEVMFDVHRQDTAVLGTTNNSGVVGAYSNNSGGDAYLKVHSQSADAGFVFSRASDTDGWTFGIDGSDGTKLKFSASEDSLTSAVALSLDGQTSATFTGYAEAAGLFSNPSGTLTGETGEVRMLELAANGTNYTGFKSPDALTANVIYTLPTADGTNGQVLTTNASGTLSWSSAGGVTDHGALTGLSDDDHSQYALLAGRSGGQTLIGGTASGNDLTLQSTSNATKGSILFGTSGYDEVNNRLGLGTATPDTIFHAYANSSTTTTPTARIEQDGTGDATLTFTLTATENWAMGIDNSDSDKFKISCSQDIGTDPKITIGNGTGMQFNEFTTNGFVKFTNSDGTIAVDTSTYITGNETITLSGDITGSGTTAITTTIAAGAVDIAMLSATGTPSSSTYLRGDNTWATISGSGDPDQNLFSNIAADTGADLVADTTTDTLTVSGGTGISTANTPGTDTLTISVDDDYLLNTGDVGTGVYDFGGATSFEIPNSATPTVNADGEIAVDTTVTDFSHGVMKYYGGEEMGVVAMPIAQFTSPTDGHIIAYNATNDEFELVAQSGGGILNVAEDTTPQLGGDLDANGFDIQFDDATGIRDDSNNEHLIFQKTTSAVNHFEMTNAATGNSPSLTAAGGDTNIDLEIDSKGTGLVNIKSEVKVDLSLTFAGETDNGNSSTADTIDWGLGNKQKSTLTGNCTYTFTAPDGVGNFLLKVVQDATGSRTVTWPASVKWPGGTAPTLSTAANSVDIITFYYDGTSYYGVASLLFS